MTHTQHSDLPITFLSNDTALEDGGLDIGSRDFEPGSPAAVTAHTASQGSKVEGDIFAASYENSPASSPDAVFTHDCNTRLPTGYFVFPDPLSPERGFDKAAVIIGNHAAASSEHE